MKALSAAFCNKLMPINSDDGQACLKNSGYYYFRTYLCPEIANIFPQTASLITGLTVRVISGHLATLFKNQIGP
jgi:hypothetical protein